MRTYYVRCGNREVGVRTSADDTVRVGESDDAISVIPAGERTFHITRNGRAVSAVAVRVGDRWHVVIRGRLYELETRSERERLIASLSTAGVQTHSALELRAPMPARIVRIDVKVGDKVYAGQGLIVLEAMKMENTLKASQSGTVTEIAVTPGRAVEKGTLLIVLI